MARLSRGLPQRSLPSTLEEEWKQSQGRTGVTPKTIVSAVHDLVEFQVKAKEEALPLLFRETAGKYLTKKELPGLVKNLESQMKEAADALDFELAALLRDKLLEIKDMGAGNVSPVPPISNQGSPRRRKRF